MNALLTQSLPLTIAVFLATAMVSLGLDLRLAQIVEPLRNGRLMAFSLITSVIVVPMIALALAGVIPMDNSLRTGFLLYAFAAGPEAGPKFVQMAKGNAAFAVSLLAVLIVITVVGLPMVISFVVPDAHVDRGKLLLKLLLVVGMPLGIGLYVSARREHLAVRLSRGVHRAAMVLLLLVLTQLFYVHFDAMLSLQSGALAAGLLFFPIAFVAGYAMGGPERANRRALAIMAFARSGSISMMIAGQVFADDPKVMAMIVVMAMLTVTLTASASLWLRRTPA